MYSTICFGKSFEDRSPIDIVLNSRKEDDVDTLVMAMFHKYDFKYDRFTLEKFHKWVSIIFVCFICPTIKPDCVYVGESDGFMKRCETHLNQEYRKFFHGNNGK